MRRTANQIEFGDFQTPVSLADRVCQFLADEGFLPAAVVEPTCGTGAFLLSALSRFPEIQSALGIDINPAHLEAARSRLAESFSDRTVDLRLEDFFEFDWRRALESMPEPILVLGNPPWTTASRVGVLAGSNMPTKSNFMGLAGLDAITGKSNFDITEWMSIRLLECLKNRDARIALLMKTSVARRVLHYAWTKPIPVHSSRILRIDAKETFGASADACLLLIRTGARDIENFCSVADRDNWQRTSTTFGLRDGVLIADLNAHDRTMHLCADRPNESALRWRSGIKHDCGRVLELTRRGESLWNQLGEAVEVEREWVFPLRKGSSIANANSRPVDVCETYIIVPQRTTGEDTMRLARIAPQLWQYLTGHQTFFDARRSSIYRDRSPFAVFGVGPYTFRPWKVAICGLYKRLDFALVPPLNGRPVVLDDTSYLLSFGAEDEARFVFELLNSGPAREFLAARIFWDAKRPITAALLRQLDLLRLARMLNRISEWDYLSKRATLFDVNAG